MYCKLTGGSCVSGKCYRQDVQYLGIPGLRCACWARGVWTSESFINARVAVSHATAPRRV